MDDLLLYLFRFSCFFTYVESSTDLLVCFNPNQSNRRSFQLAEYLVEHAKALVIEGTLGLIPGTGKNCS